MIKTLLLRRPCALPLLFALIFIPLKVSALSTITTYDTHNVPDMTLDVRITSATTSGIRINWPSRNGTKYAFPTQSGVVLELKSQSKTEQVYASRVTNNSTTETFTLTGTIVRDLKWNDCSDYVTNGDPQTFTPGATKVREVVDCRILNRSAKLDRLSTTTGSGAYACGSTSQPCLFPGEYTTAERNAFTFGASKFSIVYDETVGAPVYHVPGQPISTWITLYGSGTLTINGTETVKGVYEAATIAEMIARTQTGSTSAYLVLKSQYTAQTSAGTADAGRVMLLGTSGRASGSLLATNTTNYALSGSVATELKTISGSYALAPNQAYVPLSPIGSIMIWPTNTPPAGWLLCDGADYTRTGTGAALFAVIGTTFGVGNGTTTFDVPDLRGRFPLGQDDMGGSSANRVTDTRADSLGSSSGSGSEVLTRSTTHSHTVTTDGTDINRAGGGASSYGWDTSGAKTSSSDSAGASQPNIMNPYLTVNFIIRAR